MQSQVRRALLDESQQLISSFETHRVVSPYAGWFANIGKSSQVPPVWKQTMLVLLVLFPIVMVELKFLTPWVEGLNVSLATFISIVISVTLISFPMLPLAIWLLGWWLTPRGKNQVSLTIIGTLLVISLYLITIAIFWDFI